MHEKRDADRKLGQRPGRSAPRLQPDPFVARRLPRSAIASRVAMLTSRAPTLAPPKAEPHFARAAKCAGLRAPSSYGLRGGHPRHRRDAGANERVSAIASHRRRKRPWRSQPEAMIPTRDPEAHLLRLVEAATLTPVTNGA
jgi:hypothetical protein